jgi:hypothetical protein
LPLNYQIAIKCAKCPTYIPNGHRIYIPLPFQGPPKFTQTGIIIPSGNPAADSRVSSYKGKFPGIKKALKYRAPFIVINGDLVERTELSETGSSRGNRGCQFFLDTIYQNGEIIPFYHSISGWP